MNKYNLEHNNYRTRIYPTATYAGAHPGGGFVALPEGRSTTLLASRYGKASDRLRTVGRKGFVAWPEKE